MQNPFSNKSRFTRFYTVGFSMLLCILLWIHIGNLTGQQKGWVPDYNKRDEWQQPGKILDAIGIKPGMVIADVGAGTGYLTFRLARRVGSAGRVYATDIRRDRINKLKKKAQEQEFKNIITIVGTQDNPGLPHNSFDMIIMLHVIHIVIKKQDPLALLANIKTALKPNGVLVLVHWDGKKMGYPEVEAYSKKSVLSAMEKAGFKLLRMEVFLPRDNIFIFRLGQHHSETPNKRFHGE